MVSSKSLEMQPNTGSPAGMFFKSLLGVKAPKLLKVLDLSGKVAIVAGASTGLGFHYCIHLLTFKLSYLIIAVRSVKRGVGAASKLRAQFPSAEIELWKLEVSSYVPIQAFVRRVEEELVFIALYFCLLTETSD
jgi:hypothetical protein